MTIQTMGRRYQGGLSTGEVLSWGEEVDVMPFQTLCKSAWDHEGGLLTHIDLRRIALAKLLDQDGDTSGA